MSAYVVNSETINRVVTFIGRNGESWMRDQHPDLEQLGRDMFALNLDAVHARYPGETDEELPGAVGPKVYEYGRAGCTGIHQAIKSLQCWLYQCSEGDTGRRGLYQAMRDYERRLLGALVADMPEYKAADWG
jgi:hypothetical protein